MNVLIDSSVWVSHFKQRNNQLIDLIQADLAVIHPMIIVELACGTPPAPRQQTLSDLNLLRSCNHVTHTELLDFIEREKLYGLGCGLVDLSLLAATLLTPNTWLWTLDKRLAVLAGRFGVAYLPKMH
jgi:predicted nucleic acid-binding protein